MTGAVGLDMVSPISALDSRSPRVQALARVAPVVARANEAEGSAMLAAPGSVRSAPDAGAHDALPAGYRNLALPLDASDIGAKLATMRGAASESPLAAAYGPGEAALAALPRLVGNRLPVPVVLQEAEAALRERARALGATPAEFLDAAPIVPEARLPSRNAPDADATLRASLLARDGEKATAALDIYLTKTGPFSFEAVTYDRDFAAPAGGFPYSAPPLSQDRLLLDPASEAILALAAGQAPLLRNAEARRVALGRWALASAILAVALLALAVALSG